jgi:hypothetical protein
MGGKVGPKYCKRHTKGATENKTEGMWGEYRIVYICQGIQYIVKPPPFVLNKIPWA